MPRATSCGSTSAMLPTSAMPTRPLRLLRLGAPCRAPCRGRRWPRRSSRSAAAELDARGIDLDRQADAAVHRHRERLRAAHAAEAGGHHEPSLQGAAEVLAGAFGERLVGPLQDALRADVDPGAGGHLAEHGEAERLEAAEFVPGRPARHEVRVGDQHPRRLVVRAEDADRLAALHQQRLVVFQPSAVSRRCDGSRPVAGGLAGAAIDDRGPRDARRRPDRGCSSASAGRLPDASRDRSAGARSGALMATGVVLNTESPREAGWEAAHRGGLTARGRTASARPDCRYRVSSCRPTDRRYCRDRPPSGISSARQAAYTHEAAANRSHSLEDAFRFPIRPIPFSRPSLSSRRRGCFRPGGGARRRRRASCSGFRRGGVLGLRRREATRRTGPGHGASGAGRPGRRGIARPLDRGRRARWPPKNRSSSA